MTDSPHDRRTPKEDAGSRSPMQIGPAYYKFLNRGDVPRVLDAGTVLIRSLDYYRRLEAGKWGLIADRLEGASEMTIPDRFVVTADSLELTTINNSGAATGSALKFADVREGGVIDLSGATIIRTVPGHIYCASHGHFDELRKHHSQDAEFKYDACLRVSSLMRLCRRIFRTGIVVGTGTRFADLFEGYGIDKVTYESRSRSIADGMMLEESPFKKGLAFAPQQEARIYFAPRQGGVAADTLIVKINDPGSIFSAMPI